MSARIESAFRDLLGALQTSKLYKIEHPVVQKSIEKAYASISEALQERQELIFGIIGKELTCENEIFFDLSSLAQQALAMFKAKGVERIVFRNGLQKEELAEFLRYVSAGKEQQLPEIGQYLREKGVRNIEAGAIKISAGAGAHTGPGSKTAQGSSSSATGEGESGGAGAAWAQPGGGSLPSGEMYDHSLSGIASTLTGVMNTEVVDHLMLRQGVSNVLDGLMSRSREFMSLVTVKRYHPTTFVHILNVSTLSMFCAVRLGFCREDAVEIGKAGLFHDIGKLQISRQLLSKTGALTDEEFTKIHSHTVYGAELLFDYVDTLGPLPVVAAYEHHLKYDLSGYPRSAFNQKPHIASCIITICDVYDALNQRRSYKEDYAPDTVYAIMQKERGKSFSPDLLDRFFQFVGVWPIGCIVELSDGSAAVVRDVHEDAITLPVVQVIKPQRQEATIDLRERQDTLSIARFLNPWKEGKELLSLV